MRKTRLLILLLYTLLGSSSLHAQTPIKGVINTYYKVTVINKLNSYAVVDNAAGLAPGDKVMLVQMKGADVKTTTSDFGTLSSLNNAGNYELNTVCMVHEDTVFLLYDILQDYTPAGKVQLVYIPVFDNAVVIDSLKAKPWDNSTGTGGVLALSVTYSLILNAPVSATGMGFRGGAPVLSGDDCYDFLVPSGLFYNANVPPGNTQSGAFKGESVWEPTDPKYTGGKGAAANGGGGGNNHNNGGGGGANLGAGGAGGGNNSATTCTAANPGQGGYALGSSAGKIFPGGGGGAGHVNNGGLQEGGGHGGGIVYIQAQSLVTSGYTISANGLKGGNAVGDGASGGGGGGTIVMNVVLYSDAAKLEAKGGDGGREDDEWINYKCYGEGGGGGGGAIYMKNAPATGTVAVNGGAKGAKINSMGNCKPAVPGSAGAIGKTATAYVPVQSTTIAGSCAFVLPTTLLYFRGSVQGSSVLMRWQVVQPGEVRAFVVERMQDNGTLKEIERIAARPDADTYTTYDRYLPEGSYTYRLKIESRDGQTVYSSLQRVRVSPEGVSSLSVYPNPARGTLYILMPPGEGKELRIYDLSGRLLLEKHIAPGGGGLLAQDISALRQGLYILRIGVLYKVFRIQ